MTPPSPSRRAVAFCFALTVALIVGHRVASLYDETPTHEVLTARTIQLATDTPLYRELAEYGDVIRKAVVAEDADVRFFNHFYDPTTGLGLPRNSLGLLLERPEYGKPVVASETRFLSALEWAQNGMPDNLDWEGAIRAYDYTVESRRAAYEAAGHVLHLLQDMAQPDHARSRPHPGNYTEDKLKEYIGPAGPPLVGGKIGYEQLWAALANQWPLGANVRTYPDLREFFQHLANETRQIESSRGLPWSDESALGLSTYVNGFDKVAHNFVVAAAQYAGLSDSGWVRYEVLMPLVPTIPFPANQDDRTAAYIGLGRALLPIAEEYGAGLLRVFHDIVNPPPFVQAVQITQDGETAYSKWWRDIAPTRLFERRLEVLSSKPLEPGKPAEVRITFGPLPLTGARSAAKVVQDIRVWVEPPGGAPCGDAPMAEAAEEIIGSAGIGSMGTTTWVGRFIPRQPGTLRIVARDAENHFQFRKLTGETLDCNPRTPALAGPTASHEWAGYETGADRIHSFTVNEEPCAPLGLTPSTPDRLTWGIWTGTFTRRYEYKVYSSYFANTVLGTGWEDWKITVKAWSWRKSDYRLPAGPRAEGQYTVKGLAASEYRPLGSTGRLQQEPFEFSGTLLRVAGGVDLSNGEYQLGHTLDLRSRLPAANLPQGTSISAPAYAMGTLACGDRSFQGRLGSIDDTGITAWSFSYAKTDPPEHAMLGETIADLGRHNTARRAFANQVTSLLPRLTLSRQLRDAAMDWRTEPARQESGPAEALSDQARSIERSLRHVHDLWTGEEKDGDYAQELAKVRRSIEDFRRATRALDDLYVAAADRVLSLTSAPAAVTAQVREFEQRLRRLP